MPVKGRRALPNQMLGWAYFGFMDAWWAIGPQGKTAFGV
jgi:hypothetical protein